MDSADLVRSMSLLDQAGVEGTAPAWEAAASCSLSDGFTSRLPRSVKWRERMESEVDCGGKGLEAGREK